MYFNSSDGKRSTASVYRHPEERMSTSQCGWSDLSSCAPVKAVNSYSHEFLYRGNKYFNWTALPARRTFRVKLLVNVCPSPAPGEICMCLSCKLACCEDHKDELRG